MDHLTSSEFTPLPALETTTPIPSESASEYNHTLELPAAIEQTETEAEALTLERSDREDMPEYAIGDPGFLAIATVGTALAVGLFYLAVHEMPKNEN